MPILLLVVSADLEAKWLIEYHMIPIAEYNI